MCTPRQQLHVMLSLQLYQRSFSIIPKNQFVQHYSFLFLFFFFFSVDVLLTAISLPSRSIVKCKLWKNNFVDGNSCIRWQYPFSRIKCCQLSLANQQPHSMNTKPLTPVTKWIFKISLNFAVRQHLIAPITVVTILLYSKIELSDWSNSMQSKTPSRTLIPFFPSLILTSSVLIN